MKPAIYKRKRSTVKPGDDTITEEEKLITFKHGKRTPLGNAVVSRSKTATNWSIVLGGTTLKENNPKIPISPHSRSCRTHFSNQCLITASISLSKQQQQKTKQSKNKTTKKENKKRKKLPTSNSFFS